MMKVELNVSLPYIFLFHVGRFEASQLAAAILVSPVAMVTAAVS